MTNSNTGPAHNRFRHGMTDTPTHKAWANMKRRCYAENSPDYKNYGGRGIGIDPAWREDFRAFLADMGERPEGMTLERVDVNGDYGPGNCVWADRTVQNRNRRYGTVNMDKANAIRRDREAGMTLAQLVERHCISLSHASRICRGLAWA